MALAIKIRCFCPPETSFPPDPIFVSSFNASEFTKSNKLTVFNTRYNLSLFTFQN